MLWKFSKGFVGPQSDLGTAITSDLGRSLLFCVYDGEGLALQARAPAGLLCNGKSWIDCLTNSP